MQLHTYKTIPNQRIRKISYIMQTAFVTVQSYLIISITRGEIEKKPKERKKQDLNSFK